MRCIFLPQTIRGARCAAIYSDRAILVLSEAGEARMNLVPYLKQTPVVGDELVLGEVGAERFVVDILPRRSLLERVSAHPSRNRLDQPLAANVDRVFIVTSANQEFSMPRLERYYLLAQRAGIPCCVVLSKCDLPGGGEGFAQIIAEQLPQVSLIRTSADTGLGLDALRAQWQPGQSAVFLGSSGVGKSSLINALLGEQAAKTTQVRADDKGRHTTTIRQLFALADGRIIIDTPGLRSVGARYDAAALQDLYPEIADLESQCRFRNCSHTHEPGCAVKAALDSGELDMDRFLRYLRLKGREQQRRSLAEEMGFIGRRTAANSLKRELRNRRKT